MNQSQAAVSEEGDCHCGHSYYDHIGWREGSNDKRVSCRIIGCGCECYTENRQYQEGMIVMPCVLLNGYKNVY